MNTFKKILFATDFSDCAAHAQAYAFAFASRFKAELHLVHAVDTTYPSYAGVYGFGVEVDHYIAEVKQQARQDLAAIGAAARDASIVVHTHLLIGRPAESVVDEAQKIGCDLIITGTHGRGAVDHFLFGSNAERIVRFSPIPVLAVKPREREFVHGAGEFTLKRVLCPCDLSPLAEQAAGFAAEICRIFGAELTLLHVIDNRLEYPLVMPDAALFAPDEIRQRATERLKAIAAKLKGVSVSVEVITGAPEKLIAEAARDKAIDLITLTTHGRGGLSRALLGSTAEKLVRIASVPTLTIRPK